MRKLSRLGNTDDISENYRLYLHRKLELYLKKPCLPPKDETSTTKNPEF